jgi:hypothetical protein
MHNELEHARCVAPLLRGLPDAAAQPYDWREFQRRAHAAPAAAARVAAMRVLAATIVVVLAVGAAAIRLSGGPRPQHPSAATVTADNGAPAATSDLSPAERDEAAAQYWLERLPREPALVHVGTRAAVETLEDHIAQVDDLLSSERARRAPAAQLQTLQRKRAQLVSSLVQVRYAETLADASR